MQTETKDYVISLSKAQIIQQRLKDIIAQERTDLAENLFIEMNTMDWLTRTPADLIEEVKGKKLCISSSIQNINKLYGYLEEIRFAQQEENQAIGITDDLTRIATLMSKMQVLNYLIGTCRLKSRGVQPENIHRTTELRSVDMENMNLYSEDIRVLSKLDLLEFETSVKEIKHEIMKLKDDVQQTNAIRNITIYMDEKTAEQVGL